MPYEPPQETAPTYPGHLPGGIREPLPSTPEFGPPPLPPARRSGSWPLAASLFFLTFVSTTTIGALWNEEVVVRADRALWASPEALIRVWSDGELLLRGLAFSIPVLFILLCHEMGHYLACRWYRLPATPPYFLPFPLGLGTLGAFIRIRAPIRFKRQLFDVGVAGPLAGFAALIPILLYGLANSRLVPMAELNGIGGPIVFVGKSLMTHWGIQLTQGPIPAGYFLDFHPAALAAWVGLLATSLNLLPLGQLDGGHILYASAGRWQQRLALPLWLFLLAAGFFWPVWWIWCVFVLLMGLRHPPVRDEAAPLGRGRQLLALLALVVFLLTFMPSPFGIHFPE